MKKLYQIPTITTVDYDVQCNFLEESPQKMKLGSGTVGSDAPNLVKGEHFGSDSWDDDWSN